MDGYRYGDKVVMISSMAHEAYPHYYPEVGTVGVIMDGASYNQNSPIFSVQWPKGTTSGADQWLVDSSYVSPYSELSQAVSQDDKESIDSYFNEFEEV